MIVSESHPRERYVGLTNDLKCRLKRHNEGASLHTAKFKPWRLVAYTAFEDETTARNWERYLKTGSGRAFAARRFWPRA
ncbi:GIY-YIG nuclease family protein [Actomonas aquatica]|uniref:GIY-YIG nuclease family protein n=1 Tax=Actomonas aquatica TaxID=2866162 RepID=UPI001CECE7C3